MRTCPWCGRSTEGRQELCLGCNAPLPAQKVAYPYRSEGIVSPQVSPSYFVMDYAESYAGKLQELNNSISEAREAIAKAFEPFKGVSIQ